MGKVSLFILDGFGIGAMQDCAIAKPEDMNANTYQHLKEASGLNIPFLYNSGLNQLADGTGLPAAAYGKSNLAHDGADTFMGHQELMGSKPGVPKKRLPCRVSASGSSAFTGEWLYCNWRQSGVLTRKHY
jgi:phosphopentomutase